jgi:hypothetical protein
MRTINIKHLIIGIAMLFAAGLALTLALRQKIVDADLKVDFGSMIPKPFWQSSGEWLKISPVDFGKRP